jgi:hypothetical protein
MLFLLFSQLLSFLVLVFYSAAPMTDLYAGTAGSSNTASKLISKHRTQMVSTHEADGHGIQD